MAGKPTYTGGWRPNTENIATRGSVLNGEQVPVRKSQLALGEDVQPIDGERSTSPQEKAKRPEYTFVYDVSIPIRHKLGLSVSAEDDHLHIVDLKDGDVSDWNMAHRYEEIAKDDRIIGVNGVQRSGADLRDVIKRFYTDRTESEMCLQICKRKAPVVCFDGRGAEGKCKISLSACARVRVDRSDSVGHLVTEGSYKVKGNSLLFGAESQLPPVRTIDDGHTFTSKELSMVCGSPPTWWLAFFKAGFLEMVHKQGLVRFDEKTGELKLVHEIEFARRFYKQEGSVESQDEPIGIFKNAKAEKPTLRAVASVVKFFQVPANVIYHNNIGSNVGEAHRKWLDELSMSRAQLIQDTLVSEFNVPKNLLTAGADTGDVVQGTSLWLQLPQVSNAKAAASARRRTTMAKGDKTSTHLKVMIVGCEGLRSTSDAGDSTNPYCICTTDDKAVLDRSKTYTSVIKNTTDPIWHHTAVLTDYTGGSAIFTVRDDDQVKSDDLLGWAKLRSSEIMEGLGFDGKLELLNAGKGVKPLLHVKVETISSEQAIQLLAAKAEWQAVEEGGKLLKIYIEKGPGSDPATANVSGAKFKLGDDHIEITGLLRPDQGAFPKWNSENPTKVVRPGDRIVEVNGVRGDGNELLDVMRENDKLTIGIFRQQDEVLEEPPKFTEVVIPEGATAGDVIDLVLDDGTEVKYEVPEGAEPGEQVTVSIAEEESDGDGEGSGEEEEDEAAQVAKREAMWEMFDQPIFAHGASPPNLDASHTRTNLGSASSTRLGSASLTPEEARRSETRSLKPEPIPIRKGDSVRVRQDVKEHWQYGMVICDDPIRVQTHGWGPFEWNIVEKVEDEFGAEEDDDASIDHLWENHSGYISWGGVLLVKTMTIREAKRHAMTLPGCMGFCFLGSYTDEPVKILFKDHWDNQVERRIWTSYQFKAPAGVSNEDDEVVPEQEAAPGRYYDGYKNRKRSWVAETRVKRAGERSPETKDLTNEEEIVEATEKDQEAHEPPSRTVSREMGKTKKTLSPAVTKSASSRELETKKTISPSGTKQLSKTLTREMAGKTNEHLPHTNVPPVGLKTQNSSVKEHDGTHHLDSSEITQDDATEEATGNEERQCSDASAAGGSGAPQRSHTFPEEPPVKEGQAARCSLPALVESAAEIAVVAAEAISTEPVQEADRDIHDLEQF